MTELPAARHRRPARRPVDRAADQDRAGRPAAGDVRPQRRVAGADRRAAVARRLLRRRPRGDPDRGHLPHPGDAALRRHARQRLRAVADPRARRAARRSTRPSRPSPTTRPSTRTATTSASSGPTCATRRPWPGRGRSPARPGLEHRIGGLEKGDGHGNISYDPANHDFMVRTRAGQGGPDRRVAAAARGRRPRPARREGAGARLGLDVRPDRRRRTPGPQGRLPRRPGAPAPPQPVPQATSARSSTRYDKVLVPEMNLGQLALLLRAQVPRRRRRLQPRARPAAQGRRARRGDRRPGRRGRGHRGRPRPAPSRGRHRPEETTR